MENQVKVVNEEGKWYLLDGDKKSLLDKISKDGESYHLPENSSKREWLSVKKIKDGLVVEPKGEKKSYTKGDGTKSSKSQKWNWLDYATEEEKQTLNKIKEDCIKRHDDEVNDPNYKLLLEQKKLQERLAEINLKLSNKEAK